MIPSVIQAGTLLQQAKGMTRQGNRDHNIGNWRLMFRAWSYGFRALDYQFRGPHAVKRA